MTGITVSVSGSIEEFIATINIHMTNDLNVFGFFGEFAAYKVRCSHQVFFDRYLDLYERKLVPGDCLIIE